MSNPIISIPNTKLSIRISFESSSNNKTCYPSNVKLAVT